jgi:hypothetical protein
VSPRSLPLSSWEVRAFLSGAAGMLCRPVNPQPLNPPFSAKVMDGRMWWELNASDNWIRGMRSPLGVPGDRVVCKETWLWCYKTKHWLYKAEDSDIATCHVRSGWRSPIHMPREASRLTLQVKSVRVCKVSELSEEDAKAMGVAEDGSLCYVADTRSHQHLTSNARLACLWDARFGKRHPWASDPWVWIYGVSVESKEPEK